MGNNVNSDPISAVNKICKHAEFIRRSADELIKVCNKRLAEFVVYDYPVRNDLMKSIERVAVEIFRLASKVGNESMADKRPLFRYDYMNEYVEILDVNDDYIHFRMPMLPSGNTKDDISFAATDYAFHRILEEYGRIPQMQEHLIIFTHVYAKAYSAHNILDADRYATASIINLIVLNIGSTDKSTHSWHIHRAIQSDDAPEGTYVEVVRIHENDDKHSLSFAEKWLKNGVYFE